MKPCADCPFRDTSLAGWLGNWENAEAIVKVAVSELPFSCHKANNGKTDMFDITAQQCIGRFLFSRRAGKMFRDPVLNGLQKAAVEKNKTDRILGPREFIAHHNGGDDD